MKRFTHYTSLPALLRSLPAWLLLASVAAGASIAHAHPATERYIPIGYWASVGVHVTYRGPVVSVAPQALTFTEGAADKSVRITEQTQIYIDRSHLKKPSLRGTRADLRPGQSAEIKMSRTDEGAIEWIKIRGDR